MHHVTQKLSAVLPGPDDIETMAARGDSPYVRQNLGIPIEQPVLIGQQIALRPQNGIPSTPAKSHVGQIGPKVTVQARHKDPGFWNVGHAPVIHKTPSVIAVGMGQDHLGHFGCRDACGGHAAQQKARMEPAIDRVLAHSSIKRNDMTKIAQTRQFCSMLKCVPFARSRVLAAIKTSGGRPAKMAAMS